MTRPDTVIVLTGFMGTGKTTVGRALAARLGLDFLDTDEVIEHRYGPISSIFASRGEETFREMERTVAAELATRRGVVIATGGKLLLDPVNAQAFGSAAVFCLTASVDTILERTKSTSRPLLESADREARIAALLDQRAVGYAAFEQVPTDGRTPDEVADDIISRLEDPYG